MTSDMNMIPITVLIGDDARPAADHGAVTGTYRVRLRDITLAALLPLID